MTDVLSTPTGALFRVGTPDLEVRASGGGRTVVGIACPFGEPADVFDHEYGFVHEVMASTAFARSIRERGSRIKVMRQHDRALGPIGRATLLREDARGLYAELSISKTAAGDEVLTLVRDGALDSLSVGFHIVAGGQSFDAKTSTLTRTEVKLSEVSVVDWGAYSGALITGTRTAARAAAERLAELADLPAVPDARASVPSSVLAAARRLELLRKA